MIEPDKKISLKGDPVEPRFIPVVPAIKSEFKLITTSCMVIKTYPLLPAVATKILGTGVPTVDD